MQKLGLLRNRLPLAAVLLAAAAATSGCGIDTTPITLSGNALQGRVYGGQQPVVGASIVLYAAGAGVAATNLTAPNVITTTTGGGFSITNAYTCPSSTTQVYLVARGGNPGLSGNTNNAALVMMAALGDCGNLNANTNVFINEVTTVAAVWALAPFIGSNASVSASITNATGLRNAFSVAANLADTARGTTPRHLAARRRSYCYREDLHACECVSSMHQF